MNVDVDVNVKLDKAITNIDDKSNVTKIFIGLKNSAELFHKLDTICSNKMLNNTQDDAIREQYAYNVIKGKAQKATAKFAHTIYENVANKDSSVCGINVPLAELADGLVHTYNFQFIISYTDLLKYQAFTLYPNVIVGELMELLQTCTDAFVWAPVPPSACIEEYCLLTGEIPKDWRFQYDPTER